jgi:phage shock protein PspC (stress-responsive transcriptional regulator)
MVPSVSRRPIGATLRDMNSTTAHDSHGERYDNSLGGARAWFAHNGLTRPREGKLIAGVTAGFARRFGMNVLVARVVAVIGVVVLTPLLYLPLWVLMPKDAVTPADAGEARTS